MLKRIAILLLMFTILIMVSSCSPSSRYGVWKGMCDQYPDQRGKVQIVSDNDEGDYQIEYEGFDYYVDKFYIFRVKKPIVGYHNEDDVLIGWDMMPFGISYLDKYYSYTNDDPVFIYNSRFDDVYLREDYNYETDTFVIEGSDKEFVFSDMLCLSNDLAYDSSCTYSNQTIIMLYSKQCPRLQMKLRLFCVGRTWYLGGGRDAALFEVSDELLSLLNTN